MKEPKTGRTLGDVTITPEACSMWYKWIRTDDGKWLNTGQVAFKRHKPEEYNYIKWLPPGEAPDSVPSKVGVG